MRSRKAQLLMVAVLVGAAQPAVSANLLRAFENAVLEELGAPSDDAERIVRLLRQQLAKPKQTKPNEQLTETERRVMSLAETKYRKECPPKNGDPWELLTFRPEPPPDASDHEKTCTLLHNLHVLASRYAVKSFK